LNAFIKNQIRAESIVGFERDDTLVQMKSELDQLLQNSQPLSTIVDKHSEFVQRKMTLVQQRENYRFTAECAEGAVQIAGDIAGLCGNPRLAKQINAVGGAAIQALILATSFATMNPLVIGVSLVSCISSISQAFRKEAEDPSVQIMKALAQLREEVAELSTQMHQRFDQIMKSLDSISREMVERFIDLSIANNLLMSQLSEIEQRQIKQHHEITGYLSGIASDLQLFRGFYLEDQRRSVLEKIISDVSQAKGELLDDTNSFSRSMTSARST